MHASFRKLIILMKNLWRCSFKRFLKFFKEVDCLRAVGVSSHAIGPLYLKEFLPMSKLNLGFLELSIDSRA